MTKDKRPVDTIHLVPRSQKNKPKSAYLTMIASIHGPVKYVCIRCESVYIREELYLKGKKVCEHCLNPPPEAA